MNNIQVYLDLQTGIPHVNLQDGDVVRSVVIDMVILEPKRIDSMPMLYDGTTGRTYIQDASVAQSSPTAYYLVRQQRLYLIFR